MNESVCVSAPTADPLHALAIAATLDGFLATYRVTQRFRNSEAGAIEAVFTFPVPYGATLVGVEAELAGKALASVAMRKRMAENAYEDAVSAGDSAILVEEVSPGLHCVNLGNLAPGETATLVFTFGQLLEWRGDGLTLRVPMTIAPRYGNPQMREHAVPVVALDVVRRADVSLTLRGGGDWAISSPTHALEVVRLGDEVRLSPTGGSVVMDRDLVIELRGAFRPTALCAPDGDGYVLLASFQARSRRKPRPPARALKVLIDRSGSMAGDSIVQARLALGAIMQSLGPEDRFSLIGFGSTVEFMTDGVVAATPAAIAAARARADAMQSDLGGTEMRAALMETFLQTLPAGAEADVLLITDGHSWDDAGVVEAARDSRHRVFAIGVGSSAATHLLRKLADETGGACEIVTPREGMAERIVRQFNRMDAPRLAARVEWPAGAGAVWPGAVGSVFAGDTIHAAAWFGAPPGGQAALVMLDAEGGDILPVPLGAAAPTDVARLLTQIAAARRIDEMAEDETAASLAERYGLLTRHTNLVMIAGRADKLGSLPELRQVPGMVAAGWGGNGSAIADALSPLRSSAPQPSAGAPAFRRSPESRPMRANFDADRAGSPVLAPPSIGRMFRAVRGAPALPRKLARLQSAVEPPDDFGWLEAALAEADLACLDFLWLVRAGAPVELTEDLENLLGPGVGERELVLGLLYAIVSSLGEDRIPRPVARRVRRAWAELPRLSEEPRRELEAQLRAICARDGWLRDMIARRRGLGAAS